MQMIAVYRAAIKLEENKAFMCFGLIFLQTKQ